MSVYRSGPADTAPSLRIACAACGDFADVRRSDESFRCARCGTVQSTLRLDVAYKPAKLRAKTVYEGAYDELGPFAMSLGLGARYLGVGVECDGLVCDVSLGLSSGAVTGLEISIAGPGFPAIELRRETAAEAQAKRDRITHEVQTGDPVFDDFVFIATDHPDDDVAPIFTSPAVRAAIGRILEATSALHLDANGARLLVPKDAHGVFDPPQIRALVSSMRVVGGAPRSIAPRPATTDVWGIAAIVSLLVAITVGPVALTGSWSACHPVSWSPALVGLGVGLVIAFVIQPLVKRKIRGRSDSHTSLKIGRAATVLLFPQLTIACLVMANAIFDRSPEHEHELVVESVSFDAEDDVSKATARARSGPAAAFGEQEFSFRDAEQKVAVGQRLTVGIKRGALGWPWRSSPAKVHAGEHVFVEK